MRGDAACRAGVEAGFRAGCAAFERLANRPRRRQPGDQIAPAERTQAFAFTRLLERECVGGPGRFSLEHAASLDRQGSRTGKSAVYLLLDCPNAGVYGA